MAQSATFLILPDGSRVGPITGSPVYIGSDARCAVRLDGLRPVHARLSAAAGNTGGWSVAPGEPGAAIFLVEGPNRVRRLNTEAALRSGDSFRLGGTSGPAITLDCGPPVGLPVGPPRDDASPIGPDRGRISAPVPAPGYGAPAPSGPVPAPRPPAAPAPFGGRRPPTAGALSDEVLRRIEVELMRIGPIQELSRFWFRWKGGTLMRPDVLVGLMLTVSTALCAACAGGGGSLALVWRKLSGG